MWTTIRNGKHTWSWLGGLATLAAVAGVAAMLISTAGPAGAQESGCADANFEWLHPLDLQHTVQQGDGAQVALTWLAPGVSGVDMRAAACTWRTDADFAAAANDQHRSPSLQYLVQRRGPDEDAFTTLAVVPHLYHADGLSRVQRQQYVDHVSGGSETTYQVKGIWGERSSNYSSVTVVGLSSDLAGGGAAPEEVVCFYVQDGALQTISLPACTAEALAEAWNASQ